MLAVFCLLPSEDLYTHPERGTVGYRNGQVGKDGEEPVCERGLERQVVGDLMDGEEEVLVRCSPKDIGDGPELPGKERGVAEVVGEEHLESDDARHDVFGQRLGAAELGDLAKRNTV